MVEWVRLPFLFQYYDIDTLIKISNFLGKTLKIDRTTELANKCCFAQIYVEMDIMKSLIPKLVIGSQFQQVEYEGISTIYFHCGYVRHEDNMCTKVGNNDEKATESVSASENLKEVHVNNMNSGVDQQFGPWLLVQKRKPANKKFASSHPTPG